MRDTSKSQYIKLYLKLKQQECIIEKSIEDYIANSKVDPKWWSGIKHDSSRLHSERQKEADALKESIKSIYAEFKLVRSIISKKEFKDIELQTFKNRLQCLWKQIEELKSSCNRSLQKLIAEQQNLDADMSILTKAIRKHKNFSCVDNYSIKTSNLKASSQKDNLVKECDYDEIEDFCTLLAKTGHTGNWSEDDHLLFLKLRKKHKTVPALVHAVQAKCPDLTKESIVNHESWYKSYLRLREKQKLAVEEWRKRKESERRAKIAARTTEVKKEVLREECDNVMVIPCDRGKSPATSVSTERSKEDTEKKKERVKQWRDQKEKIRAAEEERLKNHMKSKKELKENRRQARARRLKKMVAEYKEKKTLQQNDRNNGNDGPDNKQSTVPGLILQFYRIRDQEFIEKRRSILSSVKTKPIEAVKPIRHDFIKTTESTLFKETIAWQEKQKNDRPRLKTPTFYIKDLPERAIASWRSYEISDSRSYRTR